LDINPLGKLPTIQFPDGKTLNESFVIAEYLNDVHGHGKLYPTDHLEKS